jgi:hypothetical protein
MRVRYTSDPLKREAVLRTRGLDLADMALVFVDPKRVDWVDDRRDYGEERRKATGMALGGLVMIVYVRRGDEVRLISAWPASRKERRQYANR